MNYVKTIETSERLMVTVLTQINNGQAGEAVDSFADSFKFIDCGIGLEFDDKARLTEFLNKTRELYPDTLREITATFVSGDDVTMEWTLRNTVAEASYGSPSRRVRVVIHGATVVRTQNGQIIRWSEYYDGLAARRTALVSYFTDWVEL